MSMLLGSASVYDVLTFLLYRVYLCICQYCWDHPTVVYNLIFKCWLRLSTLFNGTNTTNMTTVSRRINILCIMFKIIPFENIFDFDNADTVTSLKMVPNSNRIIVERCKISLTQIHDDSLRGSRNFAIKSEGVKLVNYSCIPNIRKNNSPVTEQLW
jgi:hypothetical protein